MYIPISLLQFIVFNYFIWTFLSDRCDVIRTGLKYYYFFVQILKGSATPGSLTALRHTLTTSYTQLVGGMWGAVATMEDAEVY